MNQKANVSKELNDKHRKILEGLLKKPENRECADCKTKGPRWASVNLGIFICMQCSGSHRSLGVYISKVRSATLDTWLPEQVAYIQSMGNEKSNSYWEAELPPNYDRVGIANFIRAKYEEKRWVAQDGKSYSPKLQEDRAPTQWQKSAEKSRFDEKKRFQTQSTKSNIAVTKNGLLVPPKGSEPVIRKAVSSADISKVAAEVDSSPKVEVALDLFDMLSMKDSLNGPEATSADDLWAGFQSVSVTSATGTTNPPKPEDNKSKSTSEVEDLFKVSPPVTQHNATEKPQKDVKSDILSLFEKGNTTTPYTLHQQQLAMLAQQQSLLMAAAAKSGDTNQNWPNAASYQIRGMMMPPGGKEEVEKYLQQMRNMGAVNSGGSTAQAPAPASSFYTMGINAATTTTQNAPFKNVAPSGPSKPQSSTSTSSTSPSKSAKEYDFSSLTQGMFSKP